MFHIIGFIILFILLVPLIGILILARILRFLGIGRKKYNDMSSSSSQNSDIKSSDTVTGGIKKKKVFEKSEGEYIDYEDV